MFSTRSDGEGPAISAAIYAAGAAAMLAPPLLALAAVRCFGWDRTSSPRARRAAVRAVPSLGRFVPFPAADDTTAAEDCLVVDCTHPRARSLTHHRGGRTPVELGADTSGGIVLNAAKARHAWLALPRVSCNHFDTDGLVAVYAALQPKEALQHEALLRAAAHLGDFRELTPPAGSALADQALLLACWVNAVERACFYAPFRGSEALGSAR